MFSHQYSEDAGFSQARQPHSGALLNTRWQDVLTLTTFWKSYPFSNQSGGMLARSTRPGAMKG